MRFQIAKYLLALILIKLATGLLANNNPPDTSYFGINQLADEQLYRLKEISLKGNGVTKDFIIYRELEMKVGDTLLGRMLKTRITKTRENLLNTSLFNFVTIYIDTVPSDGITGVNMTFQFIERWYIWPFPIFELADRNFNVWLRNMDFNRVNYGIYLVWDNFRGRKEQLTSLIRLGYDEKYNIFYGIPYINKRRTIGIGLGLNYSRNHEIAYKTECNELVYYKAQNTYPKEEVSATFEITNRPDIHNTHLFYIKFEHYNISDTIIKLNPQYTIDGETNINFISIYYKFKSDYRDFVAYPLEGHYFDIVFEKKGMGLISGNKIDQVKLQSTFRKYWKLSHRWYVASLATLQVGSVIQIPYLMRGGLGSGRYFVRGYEYYVVDGQDYGFSRSNLKFALVPRKVFNLGFIKTDKFSKIHFSMYANLFLDFGYVRNWYPCQGNSLDNSLLLGSGFGLDLVTYYDVVLRFELTMNRMKETGLYIHFMAPI